MKIQQLYLEFEWIMNVSVWALVNCDGVTHCCQSFYSPNREPDQSIDFK